MVESLLTATEDYCLLPRGGHARFYYTTCGVREAAELDKAVGRQCRRVDRAISRLVMATEALKAGGFPSGEASRVHQ